MSEALKSEALPAEVMSFGNIVNALRSVRHDYNEHLKMVPQYGAFLQVESSTRTVADTLQAVIATGEPSMAHEVIEALEVAKNKFREHLGSVPQYRALLAIDKLINDVAADLGVHAKAPAEPTVAEPAAEQVTVAPTEIAPQVVAPEAAPQEVAAQAEAVAPSDLPIEAHQASEAPEPIHHVTEIAPAEIAAEAVQPETVAAAPEVPIAEESIAATAEHHEPEQRPLAYEPPSMVSADYGALVEIAAEATITGEAVAEPVAEPVIAQASEHQDAIAQPPVAEVTPEQAIEAVAQALAEQGPHSEGYEHDAEKAA